MSDISRRDALRRFALTLLAGGVADRVSASEVHEFARAAQASGAFTPRAFTAHEFRTLERLTDLIIPVENGKPGALAARVPAWIDLIVSENDRLRTIYKEGLAWLDTAIMKAGPANFVSATPDQQTRLLDVIAYRRNETPALAPGIAFFSWVRRMTVDAFYTSEVGIKDIDYRGNAHLQAYATPADAIAYALERSRL